MNRIKELIKFMKFINFMEIMEIIKIVNDVFICTFTIIAVSLIIWSGYGLIRYGKTEAERRIEIFLEKMERMWLLLKPLLKPQKKGTDIYMQLLGIYILSYAHMIKNKIKGKN